MLELEGFQATERRLMPADGDRLAFGSRHPVRDAAFEQSVQMFVQLILEFIRGAKRMEVNDLASALSNHRCMKLSTSFFCVRSTRK
jgi:hypothetical protein